MGVCNIILAFLAALVAVNFICAEESSYLAPDAEYASDEKHPHKVEHPKKNGSIHNNNNSTKPKPKQPFNNCSNYCVNCRQALHCFSNHRAVILTCHGRLGYCAAGKCSSRRSKECSN